MSSLRLEIRVSDPIAIPGPLVLSLAEEHNPNACTTLEKCASLLGAGVKMPSPQEISGMQSMESVVDFQATPTWTHPVIRET
jgi:hypothetical protein